MTLDVAKMLLDGGGTLAICLLVWMTMRDQTALLRDMKAGIDYLCGERDGSPRRDSGREPTARTRLRQVKPEDE